MTRRNWGIVFDLPSLLPYLRMQQAPNYRGRVSTKLTPLEEPLQIAVPSQEPIILEGKNTELKITPVATYQIAALVVGTESYSYGWSAKISPVDLALAWGKLADPEFQKVCFLQPE